MFSIEKLHSLVNPIVPFLIERPLIVGEGLNPLSSPLTFTGSPAQLSPTILVMMRFHKHSLNQLLEYQDYFVVLKTAKRLKLLLSKNLVSMYRHDFFKLSSSITNCCMGLYLETHSFDSFLIISL